MSQYGALGILQEGYGYKDILKYYYSGTKIKKWKINVYYFGFRKQLY